MMLESEKPDIFGEGYVDSLVSQNRTPRLINMGNGIRHEVMVVVPAEGTQPSDQMEVFEGGGFEMVNDQGELRGRSTYYYITPQEGESLQKRIKELTKTDSIRTGRSITSRLRKFLPGVFK